MAGGEEEARKRPALVRVRVLDTNFIYPVKDHSEEIGSFCNRVVNKLVRIIPTHLLTREYHWCTYCIHSNHLLFPPDQFKGNIPGEYRIVIGGDVYDESIVLDDVWEAVLHSEHMEIVFLGHVDASTASLNGAGKVFRYHFILCPETMHDTSLGSHCIVIMMLAIIHNMFILKSAISSF